MFHVKLFRIWLRLFHVEQSRLNKSIQVQVFVLSSSHLLSLRGIRIFVAAQVKNSVEDHPEQLCLKWKVKFLCIFPNPVYTDVQFTRDRGAIGEVKRNDIGIIIMGEV
jgi:hypothetical protein